MTNQDLEKQVKILVAQGKMIDAIMLVQKTLDCGLKNAKDFVDKFR